MTTYSAEVNIYNPDAIETAVEEAADAHKAYITEVSADNGIVVAAQGKGTVNGAITSATTGWHLADVLEYIKAGISRFWIGLKNSGDSSPTVRIGKDSGESKVELDYHSMQLIDKDGNTYFHVSDLRDADGYITDRFTGDGATYFFTLSVEPPSNGTVTYTVNGVTVTSGVSRTGRFVTFSTAPASGAVITAKYKPKTSLAPYAKAYTFGKAMDGHGFGLFSLRQGYDVAANGDCSHAEGEGTNAYGNNSHAEGYHSQALGISSHAEGDSCIAGGDYSHAGGKESAAGFDYSFVHGENVGVERDHGVAFGFHNASTGNSLFAIGNGTASNPSNAFNVDADGTTTAAGKVNGHAARKTLWSGTWSSGTKTVSGISGYSVLEISFSGEATHALCFVTGSGSSAYVRGSGSFANATQIVDYIVGLTLNMSTDTLTWVACKKRPMTISSKAIGTISDLTITSIIGVM